MQAKTSDSRVGPGLGTQAAFQQSPSKHRSTREQPVTGVNYVHRRFAPPDAALHLGMAWPVIGTENRTPPAFSSFDFGLERDADVQHRCVDDQ
ncbi:hypothetical protein SAMN06265222_101148 [Neorhodopirellula lusitana]|uniref:Uncharacterized protein n=1 Tax=Neorhodopirellula lusitana TaxID=445327 RepID=A0ABY1PN29_9BACT|nr:hypothetical protein SAMN06265222_101148 [Neorhodopirellula lusitana]